MTAFDPPEYGRFEAVSVGYSSSDPKCRHLTFMEKRGDWREVDSVYDLDRVLVDGSELPPGRADAFGYDDDWYYRVALEDGDRLARIERVEGYSGEISGVSL